MLQEEGALGENGGEGGLTISISFSSQSGAPEGGEHIATPRPGWRTCMGHVPHPLVQQDQAAAAHHPPPAASPPPPTRPPHVAQFGISHAKERILFHDGLLCHEIYLFEELGRGQGAEGVRNGLALTFAFRHRSLPVECIKRQPCAVKWAKLPDGSVPPSVGDPQRLATTQMLYYEGAAYRLLEDGKRRQHVSVPVPSLYLDGTLCGVTERDLFVGGHYGTAGVHQTRADGAWRWQSDARVLFLCLEKIPADYRPLAEWTTQCCTDRYERDSGETVSRERVAMVLDVLTAAVDAHLQLYEGYDFLHLDGVLNNLFINPSAGRDGRQRVFMFDLGGLVSFRTSGAIKRGPGGGWTRAAAATHPVGDIISVAPALSSVDRACLVRDSGPCEGEPPVTWSAFTWAPESPTMGGWAYHGANSSLLSSNPTPEEWQAAGGRWAAHNRDAGLPFVLTPHATYPGYSETWGWVTEKTMTYLTGYLLCLGATGACMLDVNNGLPVRDVLPAGYDTNTATHQLVTLMKECTQVHPDHRPSLRHVKQRVEAIRRTVVREAPPSHHRVPPCQPHTRPTVPATGAETCGCCLSMRSIVRGVRRAVCGIPKEIKAAQPSHQQPSHPPVRPMHPRINAVRQLLPVYHHQPPINQPYARPLPFQQQHFQHAGGVWRVQDGGRLVRP
ncbi:unnamed protein product [Vitrella brassicaformis CCMP3155]|uniref:Protein kinase domain-containing protein n=1 Tax=Vitrella brassicaformis (strain CCMP3155) TaxID=1169540 RepID=A0A0G4F4C8_VITBC|nr:unnamed protein product [Vitrella brassicaformis CCMP3155]|eukprot:CEM06654.1 unnamed protein product [Vitrella brassicaformis CCMP3155]